MTSGNFCFPDSYYTSTILIMTGLVLFMFVLNVICCSKILNDKNLADLVPSKVIGANLSLHALLLTGAIALSIIALKDVQLGGIACTVLFSLLTALSIALAIAFSSLNLRIS